MKDPIVNAARAHVSVYFKTNDAVLSAFRAFSSWASSANDGKQPIPDAGDFDISEIKCAVSDNQFIESTIEFDITSSRENQCRWQLSRTLEFFKRQPGVDVFQSEITLNVEALYWKVTV